MTTNLSPALERLRRDYELIPVTHGRSGAQVFRLESPNRETLYLKMVLAPATASLRGEAERLTWLHGKVPAPKVLEFHEDAEGAHLLTTAVPGSALIAFNDASDAVKRHLAARLGEALARLHTVDVTGCPFVHVAEHESNPTPSFEREEARRAEIMDELRSRLPAPATPVLLHGDPCLPNVIVMNDELSGFVDLGSAELGDPRNDLVLALWSLEYNYGAGWGETLLEAYGAVGRASQPRSQGGSP